ncbi:hypothetical protein CRENBAI_009382 [Crenichthys baileyi]|uniref:Uncharacterized protein n=1 Tax=Crenichthys baileyi TaxID=28760 RepID=A0AAV9SLI4_9TELE
MITQSMMVNPSPWCLKASSILLNNCYPPTAPELRFSLPACLLSLHRQKENSCSDSLLPPDIGLPLPRIATSSPAFPPGLRTGKAEASNPEILPVFHSHEGEVQVDRISSLQSLRKPYPMCGQNPERLKET